MTNGNYVVHSPLWDNGAAEDAGAVTFGNGTDGRSGEVSNVNSVVGETAADLKDWVTVTELVNGHYVVCMAGWDNGAAANAGASMWCDGSVGRVGFVSAANALVGDADHSLIGYGDDPVTPLVNGNYVVANTYWHNGPAVNAGAVTWGNGNTGIVGTVSAANSLVGEMGSKNIGSQGVIALPNGHYVVCSPYAAVAGLGQTGAATWCDGTIGRTGTISAANSLVGAKAGDQVGLRGAVLLTNGNYVVGSIFASNGSLGTAGAVTWCSGSTGRTGAISLANSLMGGQANDQVGNGGVTPLANGHYVVRSSIWKDVTETRTGAVTWCDGSTGRTGTVTAGNSMTGSTAGDNVGYPGVVALPNGDYVVPSWYWDNGSAVDAGAVTWGNGASGTAGVISASNSLVGSSASDLIGYGGLAVLGDGNYVVRSFLWDNGSASNAGAVTWGSGTAGVAGPVSAANSIVGTTADDRVGEGPDLSVSDGAYVFSTPKWDHVDLSNAGAVSLISSDGGLAGELPADGGIVGTVATRGASLSFDYDTARKRMLVGQPHANRVSLFSHGQVASPLERFEAWTDRHQLEGDNALPSAVPHADGVENLLKFAFNMNGSGHDRSVFSEVDGISGLPRFSLTGDDQPRLFRVVYLRLKNSGLIYRPMRSTNLMSFDPMDGSEVITSIDDNWERVEISELIDVSETPRVFGMVEVVLP